MARLIVEGALTLWIPDHGAGGAALFGIAVSVSRAETGEPVTDLKKLNFEVWRVSQQETSHENLVTLETPKQGTYILAFELTHESEDDFAFGVRVRANPISQAPVKGKKKKGGTRFRDRGQTLVPCHKILTLHKDGKTPHSLLAIAASA